MRSLLAGVRVIESATLFNGDSVGMYFGDLGADVVKVEAPPVGDYLRDFLGQITPRNSLPHLQVNKNKRSLAIDLKTDDGKSIMWKLLETADVFIDGNRHGAMARLGFGPETIRQRFPRLVYVQHTGFGRGPYDGLPSHGMMMGAVAGAHRVALNSDGQLVRAEPDEDGTELGGEATSVGAVQAALHAVAALVQAQRTGVGAYIDVAASDAVIMSAWPAVVMNLNQDRITDRTGMVERTGGELTGAKYQFYRSGDDKVLLFAAIEPKFWSNFCRAVDRPDLVGNLDGAVDWGTDEGLRTELARIFETKTLAEWIDVALEHNIALGPANQGIEEVVADRHVKTREVLLSGDTAAAGPFEYVGSAAVVEGQPYSIQRYAPAFGENTRELLTELGYTPDEMDAWEQSGVVNQSS